uniref:Tensin-1-like n=1 Tax=Saccoglossus kowalevskii TaxID=10224 RepID=A0ABM0GUP5_SACKO|nr:PREDICTED: tensin-1-like [Saccoglossus kowalevskii]
MEITIPKDIGAKSAVRPVDIQVMTTCVPPVNYELPSNERLAKHGYLRMQTNPTVQKDVMTHPQQKLPSRRENEDSVQLDIIYITDRIIALSFPASGHELLYRNNLKDAARTLKNRHQEKYLVINLSKKRCDLVKLNNQVLDLGWPDHLAPPLEKLCSTCKAIESWLSMDPHNVVVLHTKGGLGRLGVVIAAYMQYIIICNGNGNQNTERFNLKRFFDEKLFSATESSQMRYVNYFSGLLSGAIQINNAPLYLHYLVLHGVPNFDAKGGCQPFFKIYQSMQPSFTSGVYTLTNNMGKLGVVIDPPLQIRGDVLVKCYHRSQANSRDVVFRCQFHTCAISQYHLAFTKYELDDASKDSRFPDYCKLELIFSDTAEKLQGLEGIVNPHVPVDHSDTALMKWDSYENFDKHEEDSEHEAYFNESDGRGEVQVIHTHGPVDGSLYAQIPKKGGKHNIPNGPETHRHGGPGMTLELDQEVNDFMDGLKIENNQNGPGPQSKSLVPVQSPTETIKRRVHKEGPKPNTLKTWFSRQQPNTTWNYTHRTLDRNKHANSLDDQISQPPSLEKTKQQQNHTSPQASGNFSQDNRNYPREHSYRGFRDDENPYAEIQDYPHSSPTSSMTSGPPQTSSFSSLSEVTNPTYGASSQSSGKMINNVSPTERDFAMHGYSNVDGQIPNQYRSDQSYGAPGQTEHHSGHSGHFHRTEQIGPIEHTHRVQGQLPDHVQHHSSHDHSTNIQHMHHQGQTTDGQHGKHLVGVHHHHRPGQVTDLQHVGQPGHSTQGQGHSNQHATGQHITHPGQHISGQHVIHTVQSTPGQQSDHHNISDQHLGHHVQSSPGHQTAHSVQHPSGQQVIHPSGHDIHTLQYTTTNERTSPAVATGNNHTRHPTKPAFSMDQTLNSDSEVYPYHLHPPGAEVGSPGHVTSVSPGYNTENAQTTRVVQVHSSSDHNQPIGVIDVHHLANQSSPASSSGVHPLQSQLAATNPPAVGSQRPNINNSQYGMHTKYEIKHQHQPEHIASGQHSPSKQYDQISPQRVIEPQKMSQQAMYQQQKQQLEGHPQQEPAKSHTTDDNLTWLEKQKKKLEEKRQQKNSPPLEDSQRQHYATLTDKSHYPIVSTSQPAGHQHQTVTYTYTEEQHKPMTSQNSNPSDSFKTQVRPSESKLTSQGNLQSPSNVNFDDINLDDLEALALSLQDSTMQLSPGNSYNGGPTSPSLVHPWGKQSTTTTTTTWHNQNRPGMQPTPKRSEGTNNSTRPYSPYEMNTNVTKLPPPSPRLGRTDSGRVCTPTSMDSTVPNRELQIAEEQVVSNPYNGLLFSQPRTIQPVEAPVTASPFHGRLFSAPPPSSRLISESLPVYQSSHFSSPSQYSSSTLTPLSSSSVPRDISATSLQSGATPSSSFPSSHLYSTLPTLSSSISSSAEFPTTSPSYQSVHSNYSVTNTSSPYPNNTNSPSYHPSISHGHHSLNIHQRALPSQDIVQSLNHQLTTCPSRTHHTLPAAARQPEKKQEYYEEMYNQNAHSISQLPNRQMPSLSRYLVMPQSSQSPAPNHSLPSSIPASYGYSTIAGTSPSQKASAHSIASPILVESNPSVTTVTLTNPTYAMSISQASYYSQNSLSPTQESYSVANQNVRAPSPYELTYSQTEQLDSTMHSQNLSLFSSSLSPQNISPRGGYLPAFSESTSQHSTLLSDRSSHQHKSQPADDIVSAKTQQEEPNLTGLVRNRVAGYHAQLIREELEYERGRQPERQPPTHPVQRSKSAGGYDSQSAYNRYAPKREEVPRRRARSPSFEMLITNPGGQPKYESEYWDKRSGLKSPETVQDDEDITGTTPQFPVTPSMVPRTPYANMVTTPIAVVERKAPLNSTAGMRQPRGTLRTEVPVSMVTCKSPTSTISSVSHSVTKTIDTTNYFPTSKQEPTNQHARHNVFMYPATSTQDRLPNTARGYEQSLPGNAPGNDGSSTEVQYRHQMREGEPLETVINGGPLHEHSSSKQPNGQPYMMTWDQRAALNNKDQEQPMRELYIETQTYEKKVMPGGAPVPTLNIAEQQSLPRQLQHMEAPKQQQHSPGYQNYPTISAAEPNQIASQGLVSYQPQISQQDPSKGVVGGHNALPHGTVMHVHMQKTTHEHVDSAPRSLSTQKPHHEHGSPAQPEHFTVSPHHEHGRPGHVQQEHLNILPHNEHGSPGHTRQEHFTTLHIDEDTSTCTPSDSSASPQQNNSGVAYEQATLPFPTSNSMMKERMQLHKQQEQEQQQEPQQLHAPHQSPQNIYPTYSDRSRPQQQMPKGRGSAPNHQPGYTTFSDRSKGPDQRNPTGHGNITLTTVEQNTTYNTLYDNRGNAADQQKSPNMTQIGSGGSGENIIGVLGSTSRKMVSPGSSHGRGSLTGSERSISPQPPGSGGGIVRSYTNGSINDSGRSSPASLYYHPMSSRGSGFSLGDSDIIHKHPMFVKDISGYWYKPTIARDEAIAILKERPPGSFIVRDSNSFPGAFGLALKVATPPPSVMQNKKNGDLSNELVRHFLIEPNSHGVRLKGCSNEPTFSSLSALVYQHSITPLALPCKLLLPEVDPSGPSSAASSPRSSDIPHSPSALLAQGAACNVLYLHSEEMESLTGPNAVRKAMTAVALKKPRPKTTVVHFKVNYQGITLTDNEKKLFFRRHYAVNNVTYCGMDPENRRWPRTEDSTVADAKIFGFVARKPGSLTDNLCHLFCEHEPEQPASAIVNFVTKIMLGSSQQHK